MKHIRHTAEQIIRKLKTTEQLIAQGKTVSDVCRAIESPADLPPLETAVRRHAGRGGQAADVEEERPSQEAFGRCHRLIGTRQPTTGAMLSSGHSLHPMVYPLTIGR